MFTFPRICSGWLSLVFGAGQERRRADEKIIGFFYFSFKARGKRCGKKDTWQKN